MSNIKKRSYSIICGLLLISLITQYIRIYPYFYAYANPLLGGVKSRIEIFKPGSLGVATYQVDREIKKDAKSYFSDYKVSAFKSLKVINKSGVIETSFNCDNDYIVVYALDKKPNDRCSNKFVMISTIKVGNLDYWEIYRRINT
jgi:hypothetical protein